MKKEIKSHEDMMSLLNERNSLKEKIKACDNMVDRIKLKAKLSKINNQLLNDDFKTY